MMREILFRGKGDKRYNDGVWYYGVPIQDYEGDWQICTDCVRRTVIPETVGQYTELPDKNGTPIFEGDVVRDVETFYVGKVYFDADTARFVIEFASFIVDFSDYNNGDVEVIGNIYDNPELIGDANE
nr:MAG TPA: YopX protein [Caudoviricetes sp.]